MMDLNLAALTAKKLKLDQQRPFPIAVVNNLNEWFNVELTYSSNALEGNTLTLQETALVLEKGLTIGGKSLQEHLEATNHLKALLWVRDFVGKEIAEITVDDILMIHKIVLKGIDDENAGFFRQVRVRISGSHVVLPNPLKVPELIQKFVAGLNAKGDQHPVLLAANAHYDLVTIHPFIDGNGRTARLLMNLILMLHGYPPAIIDPKIRLRYISSLEQAQTGGSKEDYFRLIAEAVDQSLDIYLESV